MMKSIKFKLLFAFTAIILAMNIGIGVFTRSAITKQLTGDAHDHLMNMAQEEAKFIEASVDADKKYINALAQNQIISDGKTTLDEQISFFEAEAKRSGFELFAFADKEGQAVILNSSRESNNVADRDFFKQALNGTPASSDLIFSKLDNKPVIVFSAPVYQNGEIAGILYGRKDGLMLSELVSNLNYKDSGYAYIINDQGVTVGHKNIDLVLAQDNDIENMKTDPSLKELGELTQKMTARTVGSGEYTYNGVVKIAGYAPVQNTPWIVVFGVEKNEIMSGANSLQQLLLAVFVVVGLIGVLVIFFVSSGISKLINKVTAAAQEIAQGNFDVTLLVKSKDEVGLLADAFNLTLQRLINYQEYIDEISDALQSISQGDLAITLEKEYTGQFEKIKSSMDALLENLNITLLQILQASDQVSSSSGQVASGAQALAQGATEQASSIQELSASIAYVTEQIEQNAENSKLVISKAELAGQELQQSDAQMKNMIEAMQQINSKASEISKIIKIIDDIAFQTNILALNAAVEAARAGTAGKGFAVVADEVRNLAAKSAEAAKSTSDLIEQTIETVDNGSSIADRTAHSLSKSAEETLSAISFIDRIAKASQDQATAIAQINQGVDQVSSVVQINAATAEESAAASEELSGQSSVLRELISNFNLRGTASADTYL